MVAKVGEEQVVPAAVLRFNEAVNFGGQRSQGLIGAKAVVTRFPVAVLDALHEAGLTDFDVFIEIGSGDGKEFDTFEQRISGVFGFFEDAAVELHPGVVASGKELLFLLRSSHGIGTDRVGKSTAFCLQREIETRDVTAGDAYKARQKSG